ncbi:MAG: ABC transporter ATP-binding protein [Lachnospiraceae bacterium]|nr:ABC transporter ATP-binding protein [Lachnospiraceae bacterium]
MELVIENVTKRYKEKTVVDHISLKLTKGVYGLLGANGAGKTTLMRIICGILTADEGQVAFDGMDVTREEYRACLGYLPQDFGYYPNFTGVDFLLYMACLKGIEKSEAKKRTAELLELVGLKGMGKKKIKTYSGGMKQRLGIAQALLNKPEILVLDEPTAGLDPKERVRFRNLIASLGEHCIVLLSTHIVSDVEHIADRILMMRGGRLIFEGTQQEIDGDLESFYLSEFEEEENGIF